MTIFQTKARIKLKQIEKEYYIHKEIQTTFLSYSIYTKLLEYWPLWLGRTWGNGISLWNVHFFATVFVF